MVRSASLDALLGLPGSESLPERRAKVEMKMSGVLNRIGLLNRMVVIRSVLLFLAVVAVLAGPMIGCSSKGSGGLPATPAEDPRNDSAAQVVDQYLASFPGDPAGQPSTGFFAADFNTDGWTADEYVAAWFGDATGASLIPGGAEITWSTGSAKDGDSYSSTLRYTRGETVAESEVEGIVWVELLFEFVGTETIDGTTESWKGSGSHYVGLEEDATSGAFQIVALGPFGELTEMTAPAPAASHFFRTKTLSIDGQVVYDAETETVADFLLEAVQGDTLDVAAAAASTAFPAKDDTTFTVTVQVVLFDDLSPAAEQHADAPGLLLLNTVGGATAATDVSTQGTLQLPPDLAPGNYTLNVWVDTSTAEEVIMTSELFSMTVSVAAAAP